MVLLFSGQVITGRFTWPKKNNLINLFNPIEDWTEESEEEGDKDYKNNVACSEYVIQLSLITTLTLESFFTSFSVKEHILEIIPPPPQA